MVRGEIMNQEKFDQLVKTFEQAKDSKGRQINMHYFLLKDKDNCFVHCFKAKRDMSDIRSISKTVMTLTAGIVYRLAREGKYTPFSDDTYVYPLIKDVVNLTNEKNLEYLQKIQVRHLLTHSIGYDKVLLMRDDIKDIDPHTYVDLLVNYPLVYEPGEHYLYSNAGFYLLAVTLQEFLQEDLLEFITRELFNPLGLEDFRWERYGKYLAGATRLWLFPEGLLQIGELLLNGGVFRGQTIIPKDWLDKMLTLRFRTKDVDTPERLFRRYGYGYGIWLAKEDFYFGHGTDGQTLTILPADRGIIITQAYQHDVEPIEKTLSGLIEEYWPFDRF